MQFTDYRETNLFRWNRGERLFLKHKSFKKVMSLDVNWHSAGPKCIEKLQALKNLKVYCRSLRFKQFEEVYLLS